MSDNRQGLSAHFRALSPKTVSGAVKAGRKEQLAGDLWFAKYAQRFSSLQAQEREARSPAPGVLGSFSSLPLQAAQSLNLCFLMTLWTEKRWCPV